MSNSKISSANANQTIYVNSIGVIGRKLILIINTGGTISMKRENGGKIF